MSESKSLVLFLNIPFGIEGKFHPGPFMYSGDDLAKTAYMNALQTELNAGLQEGDFEDSHIEAVYIGGGSPGVMGVEAIRNLTSWMMDKLPIVPLAEISIEILPRIREYPPLKDRIPDAINRVNLQAISMQDDELASINAPHHSDDIRNCIMHLHALNNCSINVTVMFGLPGQTKRSLHATVRSLHRMGCKQITLVPYQPLGAELIAVGKNNAKLFISAREYLREQGFKQVFFNFFSLEGNDNYHEEIYSGTDVISFGAGAYACCDGCRYVITNNQKRYVNNADDNEILLEIVIDESPEDTVERIATGYLSMDAGLTSVHLAELRSDKIIALLLDEYLRDLCESKLITGSCETGFVLTDKGQITWYDTAREKGLLV